MDRFAEINFQSCLMEEFSKPQDNSQTIGNPRKPLLKPVLYYGSMLAGAEIALGLIAHFTDWSNESASYGIASWLLMLGITVWINNDFKNRVNSGYISIGQGTKLSVLTGLLASLIISVFVIVFIKLNPDI